MDLRAERTARGRLAGESAQASLPRRRTCSLNGAILAIAAIIALAGCVGDEQAASAAPEEHAATIVRAAAIDHGSTLYFFSPGCPDCEEVERTVVSRLPLEDMRLVKVNVETAEGFDLLRKVEERTGRSFEVLAPIVVHAEEVAEGVEQIRDFFRDW